jgi:hypothetical protein
MCAAAGGARGGERRRRHRGLALARALAQIGARDGAPSTFCLGFGREGDCKVVGCKELAFGCKVLAFGCKELAFGCKVIGCKELARLIERLPS